MIEISTTDVIILITAIVLVTLFLVYLIKGQGVSDFEIWEQEDRRNFPHLYEDDEPNKN